MSYEYAQKRRGTAAPGNESGGVSPAPERSFPNSARLDALKSGAMRPTAADKGHRLELREAMRAKMEQSFGADLSNVKLYESQTVADAGAEAVARGNEIAFAPGKTDFSSQAGQALLGHELSHVVLQSRGEVTGGGFLSDSALEARADREGAMAARGEMINGGAVAPLSAASAAPMAGPMQAKASDKKKGAGKAKKKGAEPAKSKNPFAGVNLGPDFKPEFKNKVQVRPELAGTAEVENKEISLSGIAKGGYDPGMATLDPSFELMKNVGKRENAEGLRKKLLGLFPDYESGGADISNPQTKEGVSGLRMDRMIPEFTGTLGEDMTEEEIVDMYKNLMAPKKKGLDKNNKEEVEAANMSYDKGMMQLKTAQYKQLKKLEATYGTLGSQMHPEDFIKQVGHEFAEQTHFVQDLYQMMDDGGGKYFDFENNEQDKDYKRLAQYFGKLGKKIGDYAGNRSSEEKAKKVMDNPEDENDYKDAVDDLKDAKRKYQDYGDGIYGSKEDEKGIGGPKMDKKALKAYKKGLKRRAKAGGWRHFLFGGFK